MHFNGNLVGGGGACYPYTTPPGVTACAAFSSRLVSTPLRDLRRRKPGWPAPGACCRQCRGARSEEGDAFFEQGIDVDGFGRYRRFGGNSENGADTAFQALHFIDDDLGGLS